MIHFQDRAVIVTGAGNGLGRSYALALAALGASVVVNDLGVSVQGIGQSCEAADAVVDEIQASGGNAIASHHSVADHDGARAIVQTALDRYGRVDALINNAGIMRLKPFEKQSPEDLDLTLATHIRGAFLVSQAAFPVMKRQKYGRILFVSSGAAIGLPWATSYGAAKAGVIGLMNVLAGEAEPLGILCNTLLPGAATRMGELDDAQREAFKAMIDAVSGIKGGFAPVFVTPLALYLISEQCRSSGAIYSAIAGRYARVFFGLTRGWQSPLDAPSSIDDVQRHMSVIDNIEDLLMPKDGVDELALIARGVAHRDRIG